MISPYEILLTDLSNYLIRESTTRNVLERTLRKLEDLEENRRENRREKCTKNLFDKWVKLEVNGTIIEIIIMEIVYTSLGVITTCMIFFLFSCHRDDYYY